MKEAYAEKAEQAEQLEEALKEVSQMSTDLNVSLIERDRRLEQLVATIESLEADARNRSKVTTTAV